MNKEKRKSLVRLGGAIVFARNLQRFTIYSRKAAKAAADIRWIPVLLTLFAKKHQYRTIHAQDNNRRLGAHLEWRLNHFLLFDTQTTCRFFSCEIFSPKWGT